MAEYKNNVVYACDEESFLRLFDKETRKKFELAKEWATQFQAGVEETGFAWTKYSKKLDVVGVANMVCELLGDEYVVRIDTPVVGFVSCKKQ